jgi:hypothetical protein
MPDLAPHVGQPVRIITPDWSACGILRRDQHGIYTLDEGAAITVPSNVVINERHVEDVQPLDDLVVVSRAALDLVMNRAGDPASLATYPAAMQHIQDAITGGNRG